VHLDVREDLRAERLGQQHMAAQPAAAVARDGRILEMLRPDADRERRRRSRQACRRCAIVLGNASSWSPSCSTMPAVGRRPSASTMFIAALPMKLATKRFAGVVERLRRRHLLQLALRMTATRSPIVIASTWSCVT
jgi:hypothetical protein